VYPDDLSRTVIEEDRDLLQDFYELEEDVPVAALTPWLLRLILDDTMVVDKKLSMGDISNKLKDEYDVSGHGVRQCAAVCLGQEPAAVVLGGCCWEGLCVLCGGLLAALSGSCCSFSMCAFPSPAQSRLWCCLFTVHADRLVCRVVSCCDVCVCVCCRGCWM
jgi:hypothetical protein